MADTEVSKLLDQVKFYTSTAKNQITGFIAPALNNAQWEVEVVTGYISNLPEVMRQAATQHLNAAVNYISSTRGYAVYMTAGLMDVVTNLCNDVLTAHLKAVQEASKNTVVDVEKLVKSIADKTQGLLSSAVQSVVNNLYNVQDTITSLMAGGYKYLTEVFVAQLDKIPKAVWEYLDKYLFEVI